jgi:hypothetical protein
MIPVDSSVPVKEVDPASGITYVFRLITGETEILWMNFMASWRVDYLPFIADATKEIDLENKEWEKGEKEREIRRVAIRLAQEASGDKCRAKEIAARDALIDSCLTGWEGEGILPFPSDARPSRYFKVYEKTKLIDMITRMNGLQDDEIKK